VLLIGLGGSVVFYALFGYASAVGSLVLVFIARIGAGIAGANIGTAQAVIADTTTPDKRARGMALIGVAFGIGFTIGPVIGALSITAEQAETGSQALSVLPGFVASFLSLVAFLLALWLLPETRPVGGELRRRPWFDLEGWKLALGHRPVAVPLLTFFLATVAFASFEGTIARFARDELHYQLKDLGYLFAFFGLVLMLTQGGIVRPLVSKVGEVAMSRAGAVLMMLGLLALALIVTPDSLWPTLAATAVAVAGFACMTPSLQALISRRSSALRQGEVLGVNQAAAAIARILGPLLGNILYGPKESPRPLLPLYAGTLLLAGALLLALTMRPDPPAPDAKVS
jgi:MFS family permease